MFTRSIDRGATWDLPVAVNDTPANGGAFNPAIAVSPDGQHVTISFYDKRNQTISGEDADPDVDGIPNLAEYAFGLEPVHPDSAPVKIGYDARYFGWSVSYERLAVLSDIDFSWQSSTNLVDWLAWSPVLDDGSISSSPGDPSLEVFRAAIAEDVSTRFYRLLVARKDPAP